MSKLGLDIGENRCVIKFTNQNTDPSHPSNVWDTGTFEKPVWWCTKDSDDFFNMPEQLYLVFVYQKLNDSSNYIQNNSSIQIYNSCYSQRGRYMYSCSFYDTTSTAVRIYWIELFFKMKIHMSIGSYGATQDYWATIIPL